MYREYTCPVHAFCEDQCTIVKSAYYYLPPKHLSPNHPPKLTPLEHLKIGLAGIQVESLRIYLAKKLLNFLIKEA